MRITIEDDSLDEPIVIDLPRVGTWRINHHRDVIEIPGTTPYKEFEKIGSGYIGIDYKPSLESVEWPLH